MPGVSGLAFSLTALTKQRRPSLVRSRAASPGEKPLGWVSASTTRPPIRSSIESRTWSGKSSQWTRTPLAGGLEEDTSSELEVVVYALLDGVPDLVRERHHEVLVVGRLGRIVLDVDGRVELDPPFAGQRDQAKRS